MNIEFWVLFRERFLVKVSVLTVWLLGLRIEIKVDIILKNLFICYSFILNIKLCMGFYDEKDMSGHRQLSTFILTDFNILFCSLQNTHFDIMRFNQFSQLYIF